MPKQKSKTATQQFSLTTHPFLSETENLLDNEDEYKNLPNSVKYRVQALRKLQISEVENHINFENEMLHLQNKYHNNLNEVYDKRNKIINGTYEPSSSELLSQIPNLDKSYKPSKTVSGIPHFWHTVLSKNSISIGWIEDSDELLLKSFLKNIKLTYHNSLNPEEVFSYDTGKCTTMPTWENVNASGSGDNPAIPYAGMHCPTVPPPAYGLDESDNKNNIDHGPWGPSSRTPKHLEINMFTLHFEFAPNNYFHNKTLTKSFYMKTIPAEDESPFNFERSEVYKSKGSGINWKNAKSNLAGEMITKKQKNKVTGKTRTVPCFEAKDSFFNFFRDREVVEKDEDVVRAEFKNSKKKISEEEINEILEEAQIDFDLGVEFKDTIIPQAAIIFTDEYEEEDDSDDYSDSDDEGASGSDSGKNSDDSLDDDDSGSGAENSAQKPECQQQ